MIRIVLVLAVALSSMLAGCGDPGCDETGRHAAKLLGRGGLGYGAGKMNDAEVEAVIRQCKEDKWPAAFRNCVVGAGDMMALRSCGIPPKQ
jgi:hypothetical protein